MNNFRQIGLACGLVLASCCAAADDNALPLVQHQGGIAYVSGGIGEEQVQAIKSAIPYYSLNLQFLVHRDGKDAFGSDAQVEIHNAAGAAVLSAAADGPYLLVDLPAGRYTVQASTAGHAQRRDVQIVAGQNKKLIFVWPGEQIDGAGN
jgi:hypothetical protein